MPLTCRSWSSVHCDLLAKEVDPWNCFTFVRDTWAGFLFVTVETINPLLQVMTEFAKHTRLRSTSAHIYRLKLIFLTSGWVWNAQQCISSQFPALPHFPLSQQHWAGSRPLLLCSVFLLWKRNNVVFAFCSGSPVNGPPLLSSGMILKIKAGLHVTAAVSKLSRRERCLDVFLCIRLTRCGWQPSCWSEGRRDRVGQIQYKKTDSLFFFI